MASTRHLTTAAGRPIDLHRLAPADLPLFRDLQRMFAEAFQDPASYQSRPPSDAYVRRWLASPNAIALAAVADGGVVGGIPV
jgi:aminoglycoside 3-N-acetyltransferase I